MASPKPLPLSPHLSALVSPVMAPSQDGLPRGTSYNSNQGNKLAYKVQSGKIKKNKEGRWGGRQKDGDKQENKMMK